MKNLIIALGLFLVGCSHKPAEYVRPDTVSVACVLKDQSCLSQLKKLCNSGFTIVNTKDIHGQIVEGNALSPLFKGSVEAQCNNFFVPEKSISKEIDPVTPTAKTIPLIIKQELESKKSHSHSVTLNKNSQVKILVNNDNNLNLDCELLDKNNKILKSVYKSSLCIFDLYTIKENFITIKVINQNKLKINYTLIVK